MKEDCRVSCRINGYFRSISKTMMSLFFRGGAFAVDVSFLSCCLFLLIFIRVKKLHTGTWHGKNVSLFCLGILKIIEKIFPRIYVSLKN